MKQWKTIEGYCDKYNISDNGDIVSLIRKGRLSNKILKKTFDNNGYVIVKLCDEGVCKTFKVHRLVAEAFMPNTSNKETINHINGIKDDNRLENLEWCTNDENIKHAYKTGLKNNKYLEKPVKIWNTDGFIKEYPSLKSACSELYLTKSTMSEVARGLRKQHKGYQAEYV